MVCWSWCDGRGVMVAMSWSWCVGRGVMVAMGWSWCDGRDGLVARKGIIIEMMSSFNFLFSQV